MKTEVSKVNNKIILNATPIPASLGTKMGCNYIRF